MRIKFDLDKEAPPWQTERQATKRTGGDELWTECAECKTSKCEEHKENETGKPQSIVGS